MHNYKQLWIALCAVAYGAGGCADSTDPQQAVEVFEDLERVEHLSFEELAERSVLPGAPDRYLVEGDMVFSYDGLAEFYKRRMTKDKAIVTTVVDNATAQVFDAVRANAMNLRYCLTGGWEGSEASKVSVVAGMAAAAAEWSRVSRVRFVYRADLDGAGCTQTLVTAGDIDFVVKPYVGSANAAYAWWAYAQVSEMAVGANVASSLPVMTHELGHVLGLDHEQHHEDSGLGCTPPNYTGPAGNRSWGDQRELTPYDNESIMHYYYSGAASCFGGTTATATVSTLDAIGMRSLYGVPNWWHGVFTNLPRLAGFWRV